MRVVRLRVNDGNGDVGVSLETGGTDGKAGCPDRADPSGAGGFIEGRGGRSRLLEQHQGFSHDRGNLADLAQRDAPVPTIGNGFIDIGDLATQGDEMINLPLSDGLLEH